MNRGSRSHLPMIPHCPPIEHGQRRKVIHCERTSQVPQDLLWIFAAQSAPMKMASRPPHSTSVASSITTTTDGHMNAHHKVTTRRVRPGASRGTVGGRGWDIGPAGRGRRGAYWADGRHPVSRPMEAEGPSARCPDRRAIAAAITQDQAARTTRLRPFLFAAYKALSAASTVATRSDRVPTAHPTLIVMRSI